MIIYLVGCVVAFMLVTYYDIIGSEEMSVSNTLLNIVLSLSSWVIVLSLIIFILLQSLLGENDD